MERSITAAVLVALVLTSAACGRGDAERELRTSGTIEVTDVRLVAWAAGEVEILNTDEGRHVAAGDTVAVINHDLLALQRRQAAAGVEAAMAKLALLQEGARSEDVAQAQAHLEQARVERERARKDAMRLRTLREAGTITQQRLDDAEARAAVADAGYEAALQAFQKIENLTRPQELRLAVAQVRQAQATIDVLDRQIADAFVVSPLSGTVTDRVVEPGEKVAPGATLVVVADLGRAFLRIYVPEPELGRIRVGQPVDVFTDAFPDRPLTGHITFISPEAEFTPRNVQTRDERVKLVYEVKVEIPNDDGVLKPGMYADAAVTLAPASTTDHESP